MMQHTVANKNKSTSVERPGKFILSLNAPLQDFAAGRSFGGMGLQ